MYMVIFLHGDDTFRSREKLRELKAKFLREVDPSGANLVTIDGTTATASDVWGAIAAQSFLVRKRMVVVEDIGAQKSSTVREEIAAFLDRITEDVVVVFWESASRRQTADGRRQTAKRTTKKPSAKPATAKTDSLLSRLLAGTYAQELSPLEGAALAAWVRERATSLGVTIEPDALRDLVAEVGPNLWRMANEIEKLGVAATGVGSTAITAAHVRTLVAETASDTTFTFIDAIGNGHRALAIRALHTLESAGAEPFPIVGLLGRHLRLSIAAADLLARGMSPSQLAPVLRVPPFVASKLAAQARRSSLATLRALHLRLVELDAKLKSSRAPWGALLDCFALEATR